jgi:hypothetical protein
VGDSIGTVRLGLAGSPATRGRARTALAPSAWELNYVISERAKWSVVGPKATHDRFDTKQGGLVFVRRGVEDRRSGSRGGLAGGKPS